MRKYGTRIHVAVAILIVAAAATMAGEAAQQFTLDWFTIDGGGAMRSTADGFELSGSIAQPDASRPLIGQDFELTGGFWFALAPDDCNSDGGVNLYDYADLEFCLAGPQQEPPDASCTCFDQDGDGDIDLLDFAEFQALFQYP